MSPSQWRISAIPPHAFDGMTGCRSGRIGWRIWDTGATWTLATLNICKTSVLINICFSIPWGFFFVWSELLSLITPEVSVFLRMSVLIFSRNPERNLSSPLACSVLWIPDWFIEDSESRHIVQVHGASRNILWQSKDETVYWNASDRMSSYIHGKNESKIIPSTRTRFICRFCSISWLWRCDLLEQPGFVPSSRRSFITIIRKISPTTSRKKMSPASRFENFCF